jgi:hypothetical protein
MAGSILVLAGGAIPSPAEAQDLLVLRRGEIRRGELSSCDATACRLDKASVPRRDIAWIGLGDAAMPTPQMRNPLQDELHVRDGSIHPGPLVGLDVRRVTTPARTFERRQVRWIHLAPPPAGFSGGGGSPGGGSPGGGTAGGGGGEDGTCVFWIGAVGRRGVSRTLLGSNTQTTTVRTIYTVRLRERWHSTPQTMRIGTLDVRGRSVDLQTDDATVRERLRGTLSGPGGNRIAGSGTGHVGAGAGGGRLVLAEPPGPTYYEFHVGTSQYEYPTTTSWFSGDRDRREQGPLPIYVGKDPDPEEPRVDPSGQLMKGEYTRTHGSGGGTSLTESVSWELSRVPAPCGAPPAVPTLPAESELSDDDAPAAAKP